MTLTFFLSTSRPDTSYQVSSQLDFSSGEGVQNRFSRWRHGDHLGFLIGTISVIFNLLIVPMPKLSFVNLFHRLGGVVENVKS